ncbi:hypothetical protein [Frankia sp. AvcI1]|uniref:hypothetical protein n=1 Tax=Frankia sp. AvcI1 TaxID=573496 RepID=UPI0021179680|nr:hypothetical protein [Frankia sp. AvcI1]
MAERWGALPGTTLSDDGLRALYSASDPATWAQTIRDYRALPVADAAARRGRDAVRQALGAASMTTVDRLIAAARDTRSDPARHALALAMRPAIMKAALIDAAPGWQIDPATAMVYRLYTADGQDITDATTARYRRAARVDLGVYMWGVADLRYTEQQGFVCHGESDDPAEAIRLALAEPFTSAPTFEDSDPVDA